MNASQGDPFANLGGTFADIHKINEKLREAKQRAFLLTPGTTGLQLPTSGCYVAFNVLHVDPATEAHSVGGGKLSLLRTALVQLADMAGIVWDNERSGQVADTVRHPHYVRWHEECARRDLDGTVLRNKGDVCIDLRDGSDQAEQILQDAKDPGRALRNLLDRRAKILEHAQSKSQNRAIRAALKIRSYTADELLKKPFVVARLVWTTKDDDPQIERENKRDVRRLFTGGARALFGDAPATAAPALPPAIEYARLPAAAAPVSATADGELVDEPDLDDPSLGRQPSQPDISTPAPAATSQAAQPPAPAPARRPAPPASSGERSGVTIPGGRSKGQAIEDAEEKDIVYWRDKIRDELADGSCETRFRGSSEKRLAAMNAELVRRGSASAPRPPSGRTPEQDAFGNDEPPF